MSYGTYTETYTVVDIRKTFESFQADLRMIARRTEKWEQEVVENLTHDIVKYAETKYLSTVDVVLVNSSGEPVHATKYTVTLDGKTMKGDRAGGNNWPNIPNTRLRVILGMSSAWYALTEEEQKEFEKRAVFKSNWPYTNFDTTYPNLNAEQAQTYGSKGYELQKMNYS